MFLELTYPISPGMPVFPGVPPDEFIPFVRISEGGGVNTTIVRHGLHNGTHVDAPWHFDDEGRSIAEIPVADFVFTRPLLVQRKLTRGGLFRPEDLQAAGPQLGTADILFLHSGYGACRADATAYADDFPALSLEAAVMIRSELLNLRAVAIDTLSIESCTQGPKTSNAVHKALLSGRQFRTRPLLVFEDVNMAPIIGRAISRVFAFPLRLEGLEASPVNIVAEVQ